MKKAPSIVVDDPTARRLKFVSLLAGNVGVLPQQVVDRFVTNEGREEIPARLLKGFGDVGDTIATETKSTETIASVTPELHRPRIEILRETPKPCAKRSVDEQVAGMEMMYRMLKWNYTTTGLVIPERRKGIDRLLVLSDTNLTNNGAFDRCDASFPSWRYSDDLDEVVPAVNDERHPKNGPYAIWVRDCVEADDALKNLSADMIRERQPRINTITLLEREILELVFFLETGKHIDFQNVTLCSGSRRSDGIVPDAYWCDDRFWVSWSSRDDRYPYLRAREAVTL